MTCSVAVAAQMCYMGAVGTIGSTAETRRISVTAVLLIAGIVPETVRLLSTPRNRAAGAPRVEAGRGLAGGDRPLHSPLRHGQQPGRGAPSGIPDADSARVVYLWAYLPAAVPEHLFQAATQVERAAGTAASLCCRGSGGGVGCCAYEPHQHPPGSTLTHCNAPVKRTSAPR
jgi:hypothetical protein